MGERGIAGIAGSDPMTHTYAVLHVSAAAYDEIKAKLTAAGYDHAFVPDWRAGDVIDMRGIALSREQLPTLPGTIAKPGRRRADYSSRVSDAPAGARPTRRHYRGMLATGFICVRSAGT